MSSHQVARQVLGTRNFQWISFSGPGRLLRRQRGFILLVHVATELGPISVEFESATRLATNDFSRLE